MWFIIIVFQVIGWTTWFRGERWGCTFLLSLPTRGAWVEI